MGAVRSTKDHSGISLHGVDLGTPRQVRPDGSPAQEGDTDLVFVWEDAALPNGVLAEDGTLTPDALERVGP